MKYDNVIDDVIKLNDYIFIFFLLREFYLTMSKRHFLKKNHNRYQVQYTGSA